MLAQSLARAITLAVLVISRPLGGQVPLWYVGSAENAELPGSPARIELSFFHQSDTISVGWLRIYPPLVGSGIAYAFERPDSTLIVSISTSGDTIRWDSPKSRSALNGQYTIVGGTNRGQSGTWSLTPQPDPSRSVLIIGAVLFAIAAVLALLLLARRLQHRWWIRRLARGPHASASEANSLSGIGGWLAWHMFGVGLVTVYLLVTVKEVAAELGSGVWMLNGVVSYLRPLLFLESAMQVFQLVAFAIGIYLVIRRSPETPLFFAFVLAALVVYAIVDMGAMVGMTAQLRSKLGAEFVSDVAPEMNTARTTNTRLVLFGSIWCLYWIRSKRVAVTFAPAEARSSSSGPSGRAEDANPAAKIPED